MGSEKHKDKKHKKNKQQPETSQEEDKKSKKDKKIKKSSKVYEETEEEEKLVEQETPKKHKKDKKHKKAELIEIESDSEEKQKKQKHKKEKKNKVNEEEIDTKKQKRKRSENLQEEVKKKQKQENKEIIKYPQYELFVGGFSYDATENDLKNLFGKKLLNVNILKRSNGKSRGIAFITFKKEKYLESALQLNNTEFMGRTIQVNRSNHQKMPGITKLPETNKIFVGNLNFKTEEPQVRSFFERCGTIKKISFGKTQDGKSRGFCHIEFTNPVCVEKAMLLTGNKLDGKLIRVDLAKALN